MASRPVAGVLRRTLRFPPTFFTSPAARQTNYISPRYFNSQNLISAKGSPLQRPSQFSSLFNALRTTTPRRAGGLPSSARRSYATAANSTSGGPQPQQHLSVTQRMKQLFKEYGTSAIGVYLLLSVLDLPLCYLLVKTVGTEKVAYYEHIVLEKFWGVMPDAISQFRPKEIKAAKAEAEAQAVGIGGDLDSLARGEGLKDDPAADTNAGPTSSLGTILLLAYAVHKTLIFIRVPLTAAVTPKIVQQLRAWGFNIGQKGGVTKGVRDARATLKERSKNRKGKTARDDDD